MDSGAWDERYRQRDLFWKVVDAELPDQHPFLTGLKLCQQLHRLVGKVSASLSRICQSLCLALLEIQCA